jgi:hypothetical protein
VWRLRDSSHLKDDDDGSALGAEHAVANWKEDDVIPARSQRHGHEPEAETRGPCRSCLREARVRSRLDTFETGATRLGDIPDRALDDTDELRFGPHSRNHFAVALSAAVNIGSFCPSAVV